MLKRIFFGLILGTLVVFALARVLLNSEEVSAELEPNPIQVDLISYRSLVQNQDRLVAYGTVEAPQEMSLVFAGGGYLEHLFVEPGSYVKEGDLIACLEGDLARAQVAQAQAAYDSVYNAYLAFEQGADGYQIEAAKSQLRTVLIQLDALEEAGAGDAELAIQRELTNQSLYNLRLLEQGPSEEQVRSQRALVDQASAGLKAAQLSYEMSFLRAPFEGEVVSVYMDEGQLVNPGQSVALLLNRSELEVVSYLSSSELDSLSVGNKALVEGLYSAEILGISSRVDEQQNKRKVRFALEAKDAFTVGDMVTLEVNKNTEEGVLLLPVTAVLLDDSEAYVFFYYDGAAYQKKIQVGEVLGDYIEVYDLAKMDLIEDVRGLQNGDSVTLSL